MALNDQNYVLPIQYLRGVAALLVVLHHLGGQSPVLTRFIDFEFGTSGVDIFFVISGFIITLTTNAKTSPSMFIFRRIIRVVPLYWILTLLMSALWTFRPDIFKTLNVSFVNLFQSLFFIPHYSSSFPDRVWPLLVPGWTLNYEMFFYAVFALLLYLPARYRQLALTTVFVFIVSTFYLWGPFHGAALNIYTSPLLLEFLAGAWIARAWVNKKLQFSISLSLFLMVLGLVMLVVRDIPLLGVYTHILGAILVVLGSLNIQLKGRKSFLLANLGNSSYSLYLTHIFTLGVFGLLWRKLTLDSASTPLAICFALTSLVGCILVGWITYKYVEAPLTRKLNKAFF
jgi:exopolysaccharide production protein ExoZ